MSAQTMHTPSLVEKISAALTQSAKLAREDAIQHGTGIVVFMDGKIVEISAEELKRQAQEENTQTAEQA